MQLTNGTLFLNATLLFLFALSGSVEVIVPLTTMYASLNSHKSDLSVGVLILISFLILQFFCD